MARKPVVDISAWTALTLEGNLIAPAMLAQIDRQAATEQSAESYRLRKGLTLRDEIATAFRVGQSHFQEFAKVKAPSPDATRRFVKDFLKETFGFDDLAPNDGAVSFLAGGRVPVAAVPPSDSLDKRSPSLSADRPRSPAYALQDYLNAADGALWGLATNGRHLRLMRDNASLTRPAYIEADLAQIFANEDAASFALLWLLIHRSRFGADPAPAPDCALERWRDAGAREGAVARDRLAGQVTDALKLLGSGFLADNPDLAERLGRGEIPLTDWFNQLLRLIYRLIFLMVAEDRELLHPPTADADARSLYAEGYSLTALRRRCVRRAAWDRHHDHYQALTIVLRALAQGQAALALPALGGLFAADRTPDLDGARLSNHALMAALYKLSWLTEGGSMVPVNWRAMETEELGSVYESLLELQPQLTDGGRALTFATDAAERKGNQRKTTGSYYTPDSLVQALLDTALDPVLDQAEAAGDDPVAALLALSVIDPACGSGHFLLAAARRIAARVARIRADGTPSAADFRHALRDVARSCLYGVDKNPMAVELTQVALWIETVDPGLPLGFFDAQIRCGDALLGVYDLAALEQGIPDDAYKALTGDDKKVAGYYAKKNKAEQKERAHLLAGFFMNRHNDVLRSFTALRAMPETSLAEIEAKAAELRRLTTAGTAGWLLRRACDLYVAAFLLPKRAGGPYAQLDGLPRRGAETVPTSGALWEMLQGVQIFGPLAAAADAVATAARAFHWPLEFPTVLARGGFDVVLGNPPWERIKLQEQEFFAARSPAIAAAANKAAREKLIKALAAAPADSADRALFDAFCDAKRAAEAASRFVRVANEAGGRFPLTGCGDVNTYALFAELFAQLSAARGRAGVIVPTGIATDATTAPFFASLVEERRLAYLVDFENRAGLFPDVDSRMKFCLLTLGRDEAAARFACYLTDPAQMAEPERTFTLTADMIARLNPNTRTAPIFRSRADAELTVKIYSNGAALVNKANNENPWSAVLRTMFHKTNASKDGFIVGAAEIKEPQSRTEWREVHEGEYGHQFDHRYGTYENDLIRNTTIDEHKDANYHPCFELVACVDEFNRITNNWRQHEYPSLLAFRRVARSTDERTAIAAIIPNMPMTYGWILITGLNTKGQSILVANVNSLIFDYCLRCNLSQPSIPQGTFEQCPILQPDFYNRKAEKFLTERVVELTYTSHSMAPFARDMGYEGPPFRWDEERRAMLRAELDAFYARAYRLTRDELRYVLDPADVKGPDYPSETFRVLKEKEIRNYGEYRTQRLVLDAWDRMEADGTFDALGLSGKQIDVDANNNRFKIHNPASLPDDVWARSAPISDHDAAREALTAILKTLSGPIPSVQARLAGICILYPRILTPQLPKSKASLWRRLVGKEAEPTTGNTSALMTQPYAGWGEQLRNHRGNGRLIESDDGKIWSPGTGLEAYGVLDWMMGRAQFVLEHLATMDYADASTIAPTDCVEWVTHGVAA